MSFKFKIQIHLKQVLIINQSIKLNNLMALVGTYTDKKDVANLKDCWAVWISKSNLSYMTERVVQMGQVTIIAYCCSMHSGNLLLESSERHAFV